MKFINLVHWLDTIYVSVGWKDYARSGKTLRSGRKVAFLTLEYIPENDPATKDLTTGLLTNTSILIFYWFDVILLGYFFCLLFVFKDFFLLKSVLFFTHSTEGTIYFLLYCLLFINLRWVPVPVREIGVGNGERLEQFHVTIHLAIIHKGKQFVLHVHDIHNISSNEIGFTIRLFGHWG